MSVEVRAKNLKPSDKVRDSKKGYRIVKEVTTREVKDFGIVTFVHFTDKSNGQYYPEDYIQINE